MNLSLNVTNLIIFELVITTILILLQCCILGMLNVKCINLNLRNSIQANFGCKTAEIIRPLWKYYKMKADHILFIYTQCYYCHLLIVNFWK